MSMSLRLGFALALLVAFAAPSRAQTAIVVPTCGGGSLTGSSQLYIDASGRLCSQAASGPSSGSSAAITPVVSASAEASHVLKAGAGNLYSVYATNLTATAGYLVVVNLTSAPTDGAITPLDCVPLPAGGVAAIDYSTIPARYSTGITAVITSAATCFTKTTGVITGFIKGAVQ